MDTLFLGSRHGAHEDEWAIGACTALLDAPPRSGLGKHAHPEAGAPSCLACAAASWGLALAGAADVDARMLAADMSLSEHDVNTLAVAYYEAGVGAHIPLANGQQGIVNQGGGGFPLSFWGACLPGQRA